MQLSHKASVFFCTHSKHHVVLSKRIGRNNVRKSFSLLGDIIYESIITSHCIVLVEVTGRIMSLRSGHRPLKYRTKEQFLTEIYNNSALRAGLK